MKHRAGEAIAWLHQRDEQGREVLLGARARRGPRQGTILQTAKLAPGHQRRILHSGTYFDTGYWLGDVEVSGPVLVRGRDLKTNQSVVFARSPYGSVAATPSGELVGTDVVIGQAVELHAEILLDPTQLTDSVTAWETLQGFPRGTSGCIGFQADGFWTDGSAFSEVIVVSYLITP